MHRATLPDRCILCRNPTHDASGTLAAVQFSSIMTSSSANRLLASETALPSLSTMRVLDKTAVSSAKRYLSTTRYEELSGSVILGYSGDPYVR